MKTTTNIIYLALALFALACFAVSPTARAVSPPPDGGYAGGNTAEGTNALFSLRTGISNTANGFRALGRNTTGRENTAVGKDAMAFNDTGFWNTAVGSSALLHNNGVGNTAVGWLALQANTDNPNSTAVGANALANNTGFENTALGTNAGVGLTDGVYNIFIGAEVVGVAGESNTIRIGNQGTQTATYIAGISGTAVVGDTVVVDANGQLGTATSSARFKKEIKPMEKASESILALNPVTFRYKSDRKGPPQFGLIAEEVAKVNPALVVRDHNGEIYSVRYEAVNAMLLNEFLKEHKKVEEQQGTIAKLKSTVAEQRKDFEAISAQQHKEIQALTASLKEQASQIQKVNAQMEIGKLTTGRIHRGGHAPQMVLNNQ
jgi:uncharacterized coiled-coil protein SlyX